MLATSRRWIEQHVALTLLLLVIFLSAFVPSLEAKLVLGDAWRGVPVTYTDETLYQAQVQMVGQGNLTAGNPYLFEHRTDLPLVIFGGDWVNAIPQFLGFSFTTGLILNLIFWGLLFAIALYWLFREWNIPPWLASVGAFLVYLESFQWVQRVSNQQPFLGFFVLFYIALTRFLREQNKKTIIWLGLATGVMFYFYAFLWQTFVITLGLVFLYALARKNWVLAKGTFFAGVLGGTLGAPVPLYIFWMSHTQPLFWESLSRYGLVSTHLPMAEIVYSGGFMGLILAYVGLLSWRMPSLREDKEFMLLAQFIVLSGLSLWIMEGSNLITGKLLETAEHIKLFIYKFLIIDAILIGYFLWKRRGEISKGLRGLGVLCVGILSLVSAYYIWLYTYMPFMGVLTVPASMQDWNDEQGYAGPIGWLNTNESEPVVVWTDPDEYISWYFAVLSKHYVLFANPIIWHLTSDEEVRERYLVGEYFNNPTKDQLKADIPVYMGRNIVYHQAKTIERKVKLCRILFHFSTEHDCGTIPSSIDVIGENTFVDLEQKFQRDIKPNIKKYLVKYHVRYILKDKKLHPNYQPERLGGEIVYTDDRYELYRLP